MKLMNLYRKTALAMGVCVLSSGAMAAEDLSYSFIEVDYINLDVDQANEDSVFREDFDNGGGYGIKLSLPLSEVFFLYGSYSDTKADFTFTDNSDAVVPGNTDLLKFNFGLGMILPMTNASDLVVSGGYSDIDYQDFNFGATSDSSIGDLNDDPSDGYTIDTYLRTQLTPGIESTIGARYTDIQNIDGFSFVGGLLFELNQHWGINVGVDAGDKLVTWDAGVRYSF